MADLEVISCGAAYKHKKGFKFTQSAWPECWLYTFFETDYVSITRDGMQKGHKYSFVLHEPFSKVWHSNTADAASGFTDDWMYFKGDFADELIRKLNIPVNVIIQTRLGNLSSEIIRTIQHELAIDSEFREEKQKALFTLLFVELARAAMEDTQTEHKKNVSLYEVRDTMLNNYQHPWTIKELAALSGYSPSHFASLYKSNFQVSPMDDLIAYRLAQARFMLESNSFSINDIAQKCGFNSLYYFSRLFKMKNGMSPLQYKQQFFHKDS